MEDDDEVLLVMAEELGGFVDLVGGPAEAVCLLGPLGALATVEETVVRDKAVESTCTVIRGLDDRAVVEHVMPVIQRLTTGDWFTARVSACGLFAAAYSRLVDAASKAQLRSLYHTLCNDDTPMVRRAASKNIGVSAPLPCSRRCVMSCGCPETPANSRALVFGACMFTVGNCAWSCHQFLCSRSLPLWRRKRC